MVTFGGMSVGRYTLTGMSVGDEVDRLMGHGFRPTGPFPGEGAEWGAVCMVCGLPRVVTLSEVEAGWRCDHVQVREGVRLHGTVKCKRCGEQFDPVENERICEECAAIKVKVCRDCDRELPLDAFPVKSSNGRKYVGSYCRDCMRVRWKESQSRKRAGEPSRRDRTKAGGVFDPASGVKSCADCGDTKPVSEFHRDRSTKSGYSKYCADCSRRQKREAARAKTGEDRDEYLSRKMASDAANPVTRRQSRLRPFNITFDQWESMLREQGFRCAICRRFETATRAGRVLDLGVDHDHECCPEKGTSCGKCVRGLLCGRCNTAIGYFDDDPEKVRAAIRYVLAWRLPAKMRRKLL